MSAVAIRAEGLSKRYLINGDPSQDTLRDTLAAFARRIRRGGATAPAASREHWALRDVDFEIPAGDVVGVVGRNGAGKSTLLKVLSRITEPTAGTVTLHGRVASLLEVGTGFHPELTGRENIVLSGAILGMRRADIARRFDDIVEFAEVARFIDTPVKHYSSGMYLKLAFAVAAHLDPDILLVDEVLAVGDHAFQQKCLGKMGEVSRTGRTVLFVSHNMSAVSELCRSGLLVHEGRVTRFGTAAEAVARYLYDAEDTPMPGETGGRVALGRVRLRAADGVSEPTVFDAGEPLQVEVPIVLRGAGNARVILVVNDAAGAQLVHVAEQAHDLGLDGEAARAVLRIALPALWLASGAYSLHVKVIVPSVGGGPARYSSERVLLHVSGGVDRTGRTVLAPRAQWLVDADARTRDAVAVHA